VVIGELDDEAPRQEMRYSVTCRIEAAYPATRATLLVDDTIDKPNGIVFLPDGSTRYITETGALMGSIDPAGERLDTLWMLGNRGIRRVRWNNAVQVPR
jgi:hypothetical protein